MSIIPHKPCRKCGASKPLSDYYTRPDTRDGHNSTCKACHNSPRAVTTTPTQKQCATCRQSLPALAFNKDGRSIDGLHPYCRECRKRYDRQWRQSHPRKGAVYSARWRNKPHVRPKWIEKQRLNGIAWRKQHHDLVIARQHARRNRLRSGGKYRPEHWQAMCAFFNYECLACHEQKPLTVDHVIPVAHGGRNTLDNLQPLCLSCNSSKQDKTIDYRDPVRLSTFFDSLLEQALLC